MKTKLYIKTAFVALASIVAVSSCLKDDKHYVDFAGSVPLLELPSATGVGPNGGAIVPSALPISSTPAPVNVMVNIAAPKPLGRAVNVKLSLDVAALTAYNATTQAQYTADSTADKAAGVAVRTKPTLYTLLPESFYTSTFAATIPANQNSANVVFNITTANFDLTKAYVLPLLITGSDGVQISNYKSVFYNIQGKNKYDGIYTIKGNVVREGDDGKLAGTIKSGVTRELATVSASGVSFIQPWKDGSTAGGIAGTTITVDPTTNKVTMASSTNPALKNLPGYDNRYDPATKTFYLSFYWGTGPTNRAAVDTLVFKSARP